MGYTHYWYRPEHLEGGRWSAFVADARQIVEQSRAIGIRLAGGLGDGEAETSETRVWLNGSETCGHEQQSLGIAWPAPGAQGIASDGDTVTDKTWGVGLIEALTNGHQQDPVPGALGYTLDARVCGGDCSHETFVIEPEQPVQAWMSESDASFSCCKTAYKPYDVTVTALLIAFKHHFPEAKVSSDGGDGDWGDGRMLCQVACGYGQTYHLNDHGELEVV